MSDPEQRKIFCIGKKKSLRSRPHYAEEFENGVFTLKTHQMFSVHTTAEKCKTAANTGHFGFVFEENSVRKIT